MSLCFTLPKGRADTGTAVSHVRLCGHAIDIFGVDAVSTNYLRLSSLYSPTAPLVAAGWSRNLWNVMIHVRREWGKRDVSDRHVLHGVPQ